MRIDVFAAQLQVQSARRPDRDARDPHGERRRDDDADLDEEAVAEVHAEGWDGGFDPAFPFAGTPTRRLPGEPVASFSETLLAHVTGARPADVDERFGRAAGPATTGAVSDLLPYLPVANRPAAARPSVYRRDADAPAVPVVALDVSA
jgi:hypothetical protein